MLINVYIDESGSIHKNSPTAYFAIGGFLVVNTYKDKVIAHYKRENKKTYDDMFKELAEEINKEGFFKTKMTKEVLQEKFKKYFFSNRD